MAAQRPYIGGQAVLEGVMMRAPGSFAVVLRAADGSLLVREREMNDAPRGASRWPLLRGIASLVESLRLGREALNFSVEQLERDLTQQASAAQGVAGTLAALGRAAAAAFAVFVVSLGDDVPAAGANGPSSVGEIPVEDPAKTPSAAAASRSRASAWWMLAMPIAIMIALPQGAAATLNRLLHLGLEVQAPAFQAMTGVFKLAIVIGLMLTMRRIPEIRRMFQYHGAEHKTISTYEAGEDLTVPNARAKTTLHPRCGTTFLVMVALVSILLFTAMGAVLPRIHTGSTVVDNVVFFLFKLPLLPVLVAVTFELQRLFARYFTRGPLRLLLWPGFLVQKITTAEPDDSQLEVALASLRATLCRAAPPPWMARGIAATAGPAQGAGDVRFESYDAMLAEPSLR